MTEHHNDGSDSESEQGSDANRRRFLKGLGGLGVTGIAGCLGGDEEDTPTEDVTSTEAGTDTGSTPGGAQPTDTATPTPTPTPVSYAVLVLSVTAGARHDSISDGNEALQAIGQEIAGQQRIEEFTVDVVDSESTDDIQSEIPSTVEEFEAYDAVVFQNTTGMVLDSDQQSAFREYVEGGGGYVGIHAAAETHADWDWYGTELLGTTATGSPAVQQAEIHVTDRTHPSTEGLPARWTREDEWYDYEPNPRGDVHVLATLDERTYDDAGMDDQWGRDHPIAWCSNVGAGRSFYTGGGDTPDSFDEDAFREHLKGGLLWAVGHAGGRAYGTVWDAYEVERFYQPENEPIEMVVRPDGRAVYVERAGVSADRPNDQGAVVVVDPDTGEGTVALELSVYLAEDTLSGYPRESGLLGIALDPDFEENGWLYLYYTTETNDGVVNRVSRFTMEGNSIDPGTETQIIDIPVFGLNHQGGALTFDTQGNLYIGPGDDTTPFESSGYTPIDEVNTPDTFDAQRSSGNTNDLRGSVLRISPNEDGSYDIPEGNLFTEENGYGDVDDGLVKPEIYGMGFRNPFTIKVDPETDVAYVGDYGPDNGSWNAQRGPPGQTEFERLDEPGFYGWPYFKGKNVPYKHYDFGTDESGRLFDPDNPVNDSVKNTGLTQLPPAKDCMITNPYSWFTLLDNPSEWDEYMPYDSVDEVPFPQVTGGAPTQGPVYRHREGFSVTSALHASYEGKIFLAEYGAGWIKYGTLDDDDEILEVDPFLPEESFSSPIDMTVGPDGALYVVEYSGPALTRISTGDAVLPVNVSLDGPLQGEVVVGSRNTVTMTGELTNAGATPITDVEASLEASSSDISVSAASETSFDTIEGGASKTVEWDVTISEDAEGDYSLEAIATYTSGGGEFEVTDTRSFTAA
jgi:glucose/arabinose dehydrogenase/type 1 glutamine amidotransferase